MARDVAAILRRAACRRRMTQRQVAIRARLHPRTIGRLFRGRQFDLDTAERVAAALGVDIVDELHHYKHGTMPEDGPDGE